MKDFTERIADNEFEYVLDKDGNPKLVPGEIAKERYTKKYYAALRDNRTDQQAKRIAGEDMKVRSEEFAKNHPYEPIEEIEKIIDDIEESMKDRKQDKAELER